MTSLARYPPALLCRSQSRESRLSQNSLARCHYTVHMYVRY